MQTNSLTFFWTTFSLAFGVFIVVTTGIVCLLAWRRSRYAIGAGLLESLRFLLVVLVAVTLNQPEIMQEFIPSEQPTIAVLWDESDSMSTRDMIDEDRPAELLLTRADWMKPFQGAKGIWKPVSDRFNIVFESFSSTTGIPTEGTDLNRVLSSTLQKNENLCGIVLFSDGDWNQGDAPIRVAGKLRMRKVPVFAVGVGSRTRLPDIEVTSLDTPTFGIVNKTMRIPFVVRSSLPRDYGVTISLSSSAGEEITRRVLIPAMGKLEDAIFWKPKEIGDFELTLRVPLHESELLEENNTRGVPVAIRKEALKILVVESFPRWEYRYLRNALERDPGVEVSCLLFHPGLGKVGGGRGYLPEFPNSLEELAKFDVIFLGDVGVGAGQLTAEQCRLIKGLVSSQASGLVLLPGRMGFQSSLLDTELKDLFPVKLDESQPRGWGSRTSYSFELTEFGSRSLLTKLADTEDENANVWSKLPGFQWHAPIVKANTGSEVLAVHSTESNEFGRIPLMVTKTYGTGKILYLGTDGAWRWREGVEDRYHYRLWGQVARWMAYQRNMARGDSMRLFFSPDRPQREATITLNANVMSQSGEPLQEGRVSVRIVAPSKKSQTIRLLPAGEEWGLFTGRFTPDEIGDYRLIVTCRENGSTLESLLTVQGARREKRGQPARYDVLEEITKITNGELADPQNVQELLYKIAELQDPESLVRKLRIWSHPLWAGTIVFLLGVFWTGRKMTGVI